MKFAKALTLALLLDGTLTAAALHFTDGQLTPRSASHAWLAKNASGTPQSQSAASIHAELTSAAYTTMRANNPEGILELWSEQQRFIVESNCPPTEHYETIHFFMVFATLKSAANIAQESKNPERMVALWYEQQRFILKSQRTPGTYKEDIYPYLVHETLASAAESARKVGSAERVLELWMFQQQFIVESNCKPKAYTETIYSSTVHESFSQALSKETHSGRIVSLFEAWIEFSTINTIREYASFKRPDIFEEKYESAKKEIEAACCISDQGLVEDAESSTTDFVGF